MLITRDKFTVASSRIFAQPECEHVIICQPDTLCHERNEISLLRYKFMLSEYGVNNTSFWRQRAVV
jgi:hypothetical protein